MNCPPLNWWIMKATTSGTQKRFFVKAGNDLHQRLRILAIKRGTNTETMGGLLLAAAVEMAERDPSFAKEQQPKSPKR
jgi:hypothetical protein